MISSDLINYSPPKSIDTSIRNPHPFFCVLSIRKKLGSQSDLLQGSIEMNLRPTTCSGPAQSNASSAGNSVPRLTAGVSIKERLLKALSLLKVSPRGGILAQIWMPIKHGNGYVLSTSEQPYLVDHMLAGYREVSRNFKFSARDNPGFIPGLPGRVFLSGVPEWTSNIVYYNRLEYLRVEQAIKYEIRGSLAMPIFVPGEHSCCAVLELVTKKDKPHFDAEIDSFCDSLKAVDLRSVKVHFESEMTENCLKMNQKSVFSEILDVFRSVCHAHMLPIALVWVPFSSANGASNNSCFDKETLLCIQKTACYVNDQNMQGFLHACSESHLRKGQGLVGKAMESNNPVFHSDVKMLTVNQYPLAHHTRKFGLRAAVAVRLRSNFTGNDDYVLEFFLPTNCKGGAEQQLLLNNLSVTLQKMCKSLRTVSDTELTESKFPNDGANSRSETTSQPSGFSLSETANSGGHSSANLSFQIQAVDCRGEAASFTKIECGASSRQKKSRNTVEKNIPLSVLKQYYSGTLKAAAKSIGVCPTTLKRICRQNGISRWPARKINKVNHSVRKIQNVIDSVPGAVGKIKYDFDTGKLITELSSQEKETIGTSESQDRREVLISSSQLVDNNQLVSEMGQDIQQSTEEPFQTKLVHSEQDKKTTSAVNCRDGDNSAEVLPSSSNADYLGAENGRWPLTSKSSSSKLALETTQTESNANEAKATTYSWLFGTSDLSCSSTTNSSTGSASSDQTMKRNKEVNKVPSDAGLALRVKATYKEDTVRFKFFPSMGFDELIEEVAKRFKLLVGTFQLKYKDDEEEWVLMSNDDDLEECTEILDSMESENLKLLVRDIPSGFGSSTGSNNMLMGS